MEQKKLTEVVETARKAFASGKTKSLAFRKKQLQNFIRLLDENVDEIAEVLRKDLRKARNESILGEVYLTRSEAVEMVKNLGKYAANEPLALNILAVLDRAYVQKEPYGVVVVLGAWNYPFLLTLKPLIGALAAGNTVIIKPSELSENSAKLMSELIPKYLDNECYQVVLGDAERSQELLSHKVDYIFCTGSTQVGRKVLVAAAPNLIPCTLELGGKSPCYVDESADFYLAAKRVLWGKFINLGQTCIAPDYILCSKAAEKVFIETAFQVINEWYGQRSQEHPDISRIINKTHFNRLKSMLQTTKGRVVYGGNYDEKDLWIEPTLVVDVDVDDALMREEIFGPILPIVNVNSVDEAIAKIKSKPKPLALYTFAKNMKINETLVANVSSGGVCVNDCVWQNAWQGLPFGGVGESGMGNYHGKYSFDTFSHKKSVLIRGFGFLSEKLGEPRYPPYSTTKFRIFKFIIDYFTWFNVTNTQFYTHLLTMFFGAGLMALYFTFLAKM